VRKKKNRLSIESPEGWDSWYRGRHTLARSWRFFSGRKSPGSTFKAKYKSCRICCRRVRRANCSAHKGPCHACIKPWICSSDSCANVRVFRWKGLRGSASSLASSKPYSTKFSTFWNNFSPPSSRYCINFSCDLLWKREPTSLITRLSWTAFCNFFRRLKMKKNASYVFFLIYLIFFSRLGLGI